MIKYLFPFPITPKYIINILLMEYLFPWKRTAIIVVGIDGVGKVNGKTRLSCNQVFKTNYVTRCN